MDLILININDHQEILFWTNKFDVSEDTLRLAINNVGCKVEAVCRYLDV